MRKDDDYISGPHSYWMHFWWGLVFGAVVGAWVGWDWFHGGWQAFAGGVVLAPAMAYSCGRWGDRAWHWFLALLNWE